MTRKTKTEDQTAGQTTDAKGDDLHESSSSPIRSPRNILSGLLFSNKTTNNNNNNNNNVDWEERYKEIECRQTEQEQRMKQLLHSLETQFHALDKKHQSLIYRYRKTRRQTLPNNQELETLNGQVQELEIKVQQLESTNSSLQGKVKQLSEQVEWLKEFAGLSEEEEEALEYLVTEAIHSESQEFSQTTTRIQTPPASPKKSPKAKTKKKPSSFSSLPESTTTTTTIVPTTETTTAVFQHAAFAGQTTMRIENPTDVPRNSKGHVFAGWRRADPATLDIRGPNYSKSKTKIPSPGSLYECAQVDIFESQMTVPNMASRVNLPQLSFSNDPNQKTWKAPDIFVVSVAIPTDPPKMMAKKETKNNGRGYTITMYFTMTQATRDILQRVTADEYNPTNGNQNDDPKVNAVRLWEEWCQNAPTDDSWMTRFKVVPNAQNLKEIGLPGWIAKYNGKPFLIKRPGQTGFLYTHSDQSAYEFDISLHPFPYLAKKGICFMKDSYFSKVLVTFGFVIEGREEDELPECLIGLMQLCYPDPTIAIKGKEFLAGNSPLSFTKEELRWGNLS